ncbi:hypothetical protein [Enhygromyxa salina]|uniref:Glycosyltransferase RgtA/B/C/D-like domain-containing protein n=1 Tax=Enhygromyxa salina TaxID=215803 RepID=A0A2S9YK37_9BACT|nr:hypothetical protein [Enhygromyxa salina]PRQ05474.1 hypothetical protein ENSA7_45920 [Enhygromyxa salina]
MRSSPDRPSASGDGRPSGAVIAGLTALGLTVIAINAWLCDDAFITLRSVKHLVEGEGPVFNVGWRVQSFTHPAWMLILALAWAATREAFWTTIAVGLAVSGVALGVGVGRCRGWPGALVFVGALSCSRAFVEYSTAGLENPLTHLVIVGAAALLVLEVAPRQRLLAAGLLLSAAFLSRPDAALLLAPMFVHVDRRARAAGLTGRQRAWAWLLGATPAIAWELVSLVYYGALIPNTALAKLAVGSGLDRGQLITRGLAYVWRACAHDGVTFALVLAALVVPWLPERVGASRLRPLGRGAAAYIVYVIAIGGDFMEGRFLTAPALCGALALGQVRWSGRLALAVVPACGLVAALGARHPWWPDAGADGIDRSGPITDERSHYAASSSAWAWRPGRSMPDHPWRDAGEAGPESDERVVLFSTMGFYGYFAATDLHVIDAFALGDPLLARLPPVRRVDWKAGHLPRIIPDGYLRTLADDPSHIQIRDPGVARLYEVVVRVHHGPIFARGRAAAIFELLSGRASADIDPRRHHLAELVRIDAGALARRRKPVRFRDAGVELAFTGQVHALAFTLSPGQRYAISFYAGDTELERRELELAGDVDDPPQLIELAAPVRSFDRVHVLPLTMHGKRSLVLGRARN